MLKVTIDLIPFGDVSNTKTISSFYIANDGTGTQEVGNYVFKKSQGDEWEPSIKGWYRHIPVEHLVREVIEKHYD